MTSANGRETEYPIDPLFLERWSPRGFDASPMAETDLRTILEAGRWAPSAFNVQPWRFLYALRDTPEWPLLLDPLMPFNRVWVEHGSAILYLLSDRLRDTGPDAEPEALRSHSFDTGAAWAAIALQTTRLGLAAHGMTGVDFDRARTVLRVPERFHVEAAVAIGRAGDTSHLSDRQKAREHPSDRVPLSALAFRGRFPEQRSAI